MSVHRCGGDDEPIAKKVPVQFEDAGRANMMLSKILQRVAREWKVLRTRALWGWRLHGLGARSVLSRKLLVNNASAVSIGSRVTIMD